MAKELEDKLKAFLDTLDATIDGLNTKIVEANNHAEGAEAVVFRLQKEIARLTAENTGLKTEVNEMRIQREDAITAQRSAEIKAEEEKRIRLQWEKHPDVVAERKVKAAKAVMVAEVSLQEAKAAQADLEKE